MLVRSGVLSSLERNPVKLYYEINTRSLSAAKVGVVSPRPPKGVKYTANNIYARHRNVASGVCQAGGEAWASSPEPDSVIARLQSKVLDTVSGDGAQLLTAAAEWRSSLDMVSARAIQLRKAYVHLRRFDLPAVAQTLRMNTRDAQKATISVQRKMSKEAKVTFSELWLEYWMGWAPTMADIYNSIDTIQKETPDQIIKERVSWSAEKRLKDFPDGWPSQQISVASTRGLTAFYGRARVTNHNLYVANQLGLINPIQTAWQLVPFSFIVDWFTNVDQVLGSLTATAGLEIYSSGYARRVLVNAQRVGFNTDYDPWGRPNRVYFNGTYNSVMLGRAPGSLRHPPLHMKFDRLSLTRAATSISLLREIFLRK